MKAVWNNTVVAEADKQDLIFIERHWYFPPHAVKKEVIRPSSTPYFCHWKGACQYFDLSDGVAVSRDTAWTYTEPYPSAIDIVKKDFSHYVAFWRDVTIVEES